MDWGAGFEAIRPWLTTGFIGGILALVVKLYVDNRRLRLDEQIRAQDYTLEVSADGRTNLQFVIDNLVRDITAQREAHADCQTELTGAKERIRSLEHHHDGLQRQFVQYQITVARAIPPNERSPEIDAMLLLLEDLAAQPSTLFTEGETTTTDAPGKSRSRRFRRKD